MIPAASMLSSKSPRVKTHPPEWKLMYSKCKVGEKAVMNYSDTHCELSLSYIEDFTANRIKLQDITYFLSLYPVSLLYVPTLPEI